MTNIWRSIRVTVIFAILLGLVYPLLVTLIGHLLFPYQAQGSMVTHNGKIVGSELIAQATKKPGLFHPRPSAVDYAANGSAGSNLGSTNPALVKEVKGNLEQAEEQTGKKAALIPLDMVESSGSGLDPDISISNANLQIPRIAKAAGLSQDDLHDIVSTHRNGRFLGIFGEPTVNVLNLNLAIEKKLGR